MEETSQRNRAVVWLSLIILLGLGIRLTGLAWGQGYTYFGSGDSLEAYSHTVDYACGDAKAQYLAQPNFSEHAKLPGPLWTLFCYWGLRFWGSMDGVIVETILLNTATICLTYLLAKRVLGPPCALWAALFAATLPFPVFYSVFVYNPNVMPFLGGLLFLALWKVARRDRSRCIFWVVLLLMVMPQFHMSVVSLLPAVGIVLALASIRLNVPWLLGGGLAGILLYVPYLRGEIAHGWQNTIGMSSGRTGHWWGGLKALIAPWNLLVDYVPQWTRSAEEYSRLGKACFGHFGVLLLLNLLSALVAVVLLALMFREIRTAMRGFWRSPRQTFSRSPGVLFLAILTVMPLLFALFSRQSFHARYCIVLLPSLLSLAGYAVVKGLDRPQLSRLFVPAIVVMTCGNVWFMPAMYHYQGARIEQGEVFYSSFRNLEIVYQHLKVYAGANHSVQVNDAGYLKALAPGDKVHRDAGLIRRYVNIREKEIGARASAKAAPVTYTLCPADQVMQGGAGVAYLAHGIAMVAAPPPR